MNILFILPRIPGAAVGGYRIVFEYANRLSNEFNVSLLFLNDDAYQRFHLPELFRKKLSNLMTQIEPKWFKLNSGITKISSYDSKLKEKLAGTDVCIATAVETLFFMNSYFPNSKKLYLIQDFENWNNSDQYVTQSFSGDTTNIVISAWLKKIVDIYSKQPSILISNPIDLSVYKIINPVQERPLHSISLLYHNKPHKGFQYALAALQKLKVKYVDLDVVMFGIFDPDFKLPSWIKYYKNATFKKTVEIYNSTSVFLCATIEEGYGLTGLEAIACGNVLVSTDYRGVREYATDGYNALLSPIKNVDALVENVERVFENKALREKLVKNGQESVKGFSWDTSYEKFKKVIEGYK